MTRPVYLSTEIERLTAQVEAMREVEKEIILRLQWAHCTTYHKDMEALFREILAAENPLQHLKELTFAFTATTNKPTELVAMQAEQKAVEEWLTECTDGRVSDQTKLMLRLFSHWLHDRLASTAPASGDEVELDRLAELLANFARDRFANTKELTWATMGEHSRQYFRDAVNVVRAALRPRSEREEIVAWLREQETERLEQIGHGLSGGGPQYDLGRATAYAHAADAIERGDFKESGE